MWSPGGGGGARLTLLIRNMTALENGNPVVMELDQRGAVIGRSPTVDWSLPDPRSYISSRHCEIGYIDGSYFLTDISTNGTFLNGGGERLAQAVLLKQGDVINIGHYEVAVTLSGGAPAPGAAPPPPADAGSGWSWDAHNAAPPPPAVDPASWDRPKPVAALAGGALSGAWSAPGAVGAGSGWGSGPVAPAAPSANASWGATAAPAATPAPPGDSWGVGAAPPVAAPSSDSWGTAPSAPAAPADSWGIAPAAPAAAPPASDGWGAPPPQSDAPVAPSWAAPGGADDFVAPSADNGNPSAWAQPEVKAEAASAWSSAAPDRPPPPTTNDVWGKINDGNVVDWARGGFGGAPAATPDPQAPDMLGLSSRSALDALPKAPLPSYAPPAADPFAAAPAFTPQAPPPRVNPAPAPIHAAAPPPQAAPPAAAPPHPAPPPQAGASIDSFLAEAGLKPADLRQSGDATLGSAGRLLKRLVSGMVVMLEARARAKSQMGAQSTSLEFDGNNPLKFARTPEQALAQLLNPKEKGFMDADRAIEDAFHDLQSHQIATLKAMQGALRATLDRFSPTAIKNRAAAGGLFSRIMPGAKDAALWQAYEREFGGVAQGSDEAFMDVFAREFKKAYEEQAAKRPRR